MQKIHETLYILHKCNLNLKTAYEGMKEHQQTGLISRNHFTLNLGYYAIMETNSFMDEYNKYFIAGDDESINLRIERVKKISKPVIKRVKKWSGIQNFRNEIIAHGWRSSGKFTIPQNPVYKVPRTYLEVQFLRDLIGYVYGFINCEFEKEIGEALFFREKMQQSVNYVYPSINFINAEVDKMQGELNKVETALKKDYEVVILKYH